jgi:catalase
MGEYLTNHPSAAAFVQDPKPFPQSFATEKFFGVNAFKLIADDGKVTTIRYRITPDAGEAHISDEEASSRDAAYLHNEIQTRVIDGGASFKLLAQIGQEGDVTDDATIHWPEDRKIVELGTIKLDGVLDDNDEEQRKVIFDPVPRVDGVEASDDPLLDMRASIYLQSGRERRSHPYEK